MKPPLLGGCRDGREGRYCWGGAETTDEAATAGGCRDGRRATTAGGAAEKGEESSNARRGTEMAVAIPDGVCSQTAEGPSVLGGVSADGQVNHSGGRYGGGRLGGMKWQGNPFENLLHKSR